MALCVICKKIKPRSRKQKSAVCWNQFNICKRCDSKIVDSSTLTGKVYRHRDTRLVTTCVICGREEDRPRYSMSPTCNFGGCRSEWYRRQRENDARRLEWIRLAHWSKRYEKELVIRRL